MTDKYLNYICKALDIIICLLLKGDSVDEAEAMEILKKLKEEKLK
jgi:hypothetical protein